MSAGLVVALDAKALPPKPAAIYIIQGGHLWQSHGDDSVTQQGNDNWATTTSFVTNDYNAAYAIADSKLWLIQPELGVRWQLGSDPWAGPTELAYGFNQELGDAFLWAVQNGYLYRVELSGGQPTRLGRRSWLGSTSMAYLDYDGTRNDLFIVQDNSLWRVNSGTGAYTLLGDAGTWVGNTSMTAANGQLYMAESGRLWRVSPATGAFTKLGPSVWADVTSMTQLYGYLYVIQNEHLHSVNMSTGAYHVLGDPDWGGPTFIGSTPERPF